MFRFFLLIKKCLYCYFLLVAEVCTKNFATLCIFNLFQSITSKFGATLWSFFSIRKELITYLEEFGATSQTQGPELEYT